MLQFNMFSGCQFFLAITRPYNYSLLHLDMSNLQSWLSGLSITLSEWEIACSVPSGVLLPEWQLHAYTF
jgi:hypothetical protein